MKKMLCVGRVFLAVVPFLSIGLGARAAPLPTWNRVFMSTTGNDANNCSSQATPCLTFVGAQAQTNAGGEIIAMATGGYGLLNITQSVTINGPAGVVIFSNFPVGVNAPGATVVLRGLTVDGTGQTGNGINVTSVGVLHVESCVITGWAQANTTTGDGIYFTSPGKLFVKDTIIRGNGFIGIFLNPSSSTVQASVDHCRLEANWVGLLTEANAQATIRDSVASGNSRGIEVDAGEANAEGCLIANNSSAGVYSFSGTALLSNCTITDNASGLILAGGSIFSFGNNRVAGNGTAGSFTGTISQQ